MTSRSARVRQGEPAASGRGAVRIKRVYDAVEPDDGFRVLVDRLWPRGVTREEAAIDAWEKELAPSPQLRTWFGHLPERFDRFRATYIEELCRQDEKLGALRERARAGTVTLLYAARNRERNNAVVLAEVLSRAADDGPPYFSH